MEHHEEGEEEKNVQLANIVNYPKYYMCVGLFFNCKEINILNSPFRSTIQKLSV